DYRFGDLLQASSRFSDLMKRLVSAQSATQCVPPNLWVLTPANFALVQQALGRSDEALKLSDEALRRGRQLKHLYSLGVVISFAGALRYQRREPEAARELAEAEIAFAEEHGFRDRLLGGRSLRGWAVTILGQAEQGVADLERAAGSEPSVFQRRARD